LLVTVSIICIVKYEDWLYNTIVEIVRLDSPENDINVKAFVIY